MIYPSVQCLDVHVRAIVTDFDLSIGVRVTTLVFAFQHTDSGSFLQAQKGDEDMPKQVKYCLPVGRRDDVMRASPLSGRNEP